MSHSLLWKFPVMVGLTLEKERYVLSSSVAKKVFFVYYAKVLLKGSALDSF